MPNGEWGIEDVPFSLDCFDDRVIPIRHFTFERSHMSRHLIAYPLWLGLGLLLAANVRAEDKPAAKPAAEKPAVAQPTTVEKKPAEKKPEEKKAAETKPKEPAAAVKPAPVKAPAAKPLRRQAAFRGQFLEADCADPAQELRRLPRPQRAQGPIPGSELRQPGEAGRERRAVGNTGQARPERALSV